jgi:hypothetical protein
MSKLHNNRIQQCGVCGVMTMDGRNIPSTNRNQKTGAMEHANFICRYCEWEQRSLRLIEKAADVRLNEG